MPMFQTIYQSDLPPRAVTVYMYLSDRRNKEGTAFPSIRTITRDTKLSRSTVKRALDDLEGAGLIAKERRWRDNGSSSSNLYRFPNR